MPAFLRELGAGVSDSAWKVGELAAKAGGAVESVQAGVYDKVHKHTGDDKIGSILSRLEDGEVNEDTFVREAQPWITTPSAKKAILEKASKELKGRGGWEAEDI